MQLDKIHHLDCVEGMRQLDTKSVDLVVTSPPYNAGIEYAEYNDNREWGEYYEWCRTWLKELFRVLKDDGRVCINHFLNYGDKNGRNSPIMELNRIAQEVGFKHHGIALWTDNNITKRTAWGSWLSASAPYINLSTEGVLILYKSYWKKLLKGESDISREEFMEAATGRWNIHPEGKQLTKACFPVELPKRCIRLLTYVGDVVLDPFMGSGSTAVACQQTGRRFIGFEVSKEYVEVAERRLAQRSLIETEVSGAKALRTPPTTKDVVGIRAGDIL